VAGGERAALLAADRDDGLAVLDDEEADAAGAFAHHRLPGAEGAVGKAARERLQVPVVEALEERDALEEFDGCGHCPILVVWPATLPRRTLPVRPLPGFAGR